MASMSFRRAWRGAPTSAAGSPASSALPRGGHVVRLRECRAVAAHSPRVSRGCQFWRVETSNRAPESRVGPSGRPHRSRLLVGNDTNAEPGWHAPTAPSIPREPLPSSGWHRVRARLPAGRWGRVSSPQEDRRPYPTAESGVCRVGHAGCARRPPHHRLLRRTARRGSWP
jgi:hypothetical protein